MGGGKLYYSLFKMVLILAHTCKGSCMLTWIAPLVWSFALSPYCHTGSKEIHVYGDILPYFHTMLLGENASVQTESIEACYNFFSVKLV